MIKNRVFPICSKCKHFIRIHSDPYMDLNKCNLFGTKNMITGKITYDYAELCRQDMKKCGPLGRHFIPKDVIIIPNKELR